MGAAASSLTMGIVVDEEFFRVTAETPIGKHQDTIPLSGKMIETTDVQGHKMRICCKWEDDSKRTMLFECRNLTTKKGHKMQRIMLSENEFKDVITNDDNVTMIRYFRRKKK